MDAHKPRIYSHFIWGSEPKGDGSFHPWEIFNVIPCDDKGRPCSDHLAERIFRDAKKCNPDCLFVMTTEPKLPNTN